MVLAATGSKRGALADMDKAAIDIAQVLPRLTGTRAEQIKGLRIPAGDIEALVLDHLRTFFASRTAVADSLVPFGLDVAIQQAVLDRSARLAERWARLASFELREIVRSLVQQIQIDDAQITVWLNRSAIISSIMPDFASRQTD
jgi:hypothetical protein